MDYDVVVIGCGSAGSRAAAAAHESGARVLALDGGGPSVYVDFTDLPCHAGTPQDLVNPWTLAFGPAGDALYVATDPNHRTVHRFDAAGNLVRAARCADEAPNYLLCV